MPVKQYVFDGTMWRGGANGDISPGGSSRDDLVPMVDKPDDTNTGPYTVNSWVDVFPSAGNNFITISTPGTITGRRYWGQLRFTSPNIILRECWIVGPDPDTYSSFTGSAINYGTNPPLVELWDCVIDASVWVTLQGRTALNPYSAGWHGGQVRMYRSEITNVGDAVNSVGPSTQSAALAAQTLFQQCWFHKGFYANDTYPPADGQCHDDGFQTNTGRNITLRGNTIGGTRDITGYNTWPGGYNSGDDFWNSGFMLKQEVDMTETNRICNVLIEGNWIGGGTSSINHNYVSARPNAWDDNVIIRNNKFLTRGANWGQSKQGSGPGTPGVTVNTGAGTYIYRSTSIASTYTNNVNEQTGVAVPVYTASDS